MENENKRYDKEYKIMNGCFGKDNLLSLATFDGERLSVRCVDAYFEDGCFYVISYALSEKVRQITENPKVAFCTPDWLTGHGTAENTGYIYSDENRATVEKLKVAFAAWYNNGHNDYEDRNTIILRIKVSDCAFYHEGAKLSLCFD